MITSIVCNGKIRTTKLYTLRIIYLILGSLFFNLKKKSHFLIGLIRVLMSSFLSSLYILEIRPLSDAGLVKIFSHSVGCLFVLMTVSLLYRSFSVSGVPIYSLLLLLSVLLRFYVESGLLCPCLVDYFPLSLLSGSVFSD